MVSTITYTCRPIIPKCKHSIPNLQKRNVCLAKQAHRSCHRYLVLHARILCNEHVSVVQRKVYDVIGGCSFDFQQAANEKLLALVTLGMQCTGCQCIIIINSSPFTVHALSAMEFLSYINKNVQ